MGEFGQAKENAANDYLKLWKKSNAVVNPKGHFKNGVNWCRKYNLTAMTKLFLSAKKTEADLALAVSALEQIKRGDIDCDGRRVILFEAMMEYAAEALTKLKSSDKGK